MRSSGTNIVIGSGNESLSTKLSYKNPNMYECEGGFLYINNGVVERYEGSGGNIEIPSEHNGVRVTSIADHAFEKTAINSVVIPEGVTSIGEGAFYECVWLTSVSMPDTVETIGDYAFSHSSRLQTINLSRSLTRIPTNLFNSCSSLNTVLIPEGVTAIGGGAFIASGIKSVYIPDSVTSLEEQVNFANCPNLGKVVIGNGLTSIPEYCFSSCPNLKQVVIGSNVSVIKECAFGFCDSLTDISLPTSLVSVEIPFISSQLNPYANIYYEGSSDQWGHIRYYGSLYSYDPMISGKKIYNSQLHYCSYGDSVSGYPALEIYKAGSIETVMDIDREDMELIGWSYSPGGDAGLFYQVSLWIRRRTMCCILCGKEQENQAL